MALQWRETSFLAAHSTSRVQMPIDFAVEAPEEDLDFILEVEEAIRPTRVEISEGFSSSSENQDDSQSTTIEARLDTMPQVTSEVTPVTLETLQDELQMMQRETWALQHLLVSNGNSEGEAAQGLVEAWQQRNVFQGVARTAEAGMVSVGVSSTTSQVVCRREHTEEVVTHRRFASRRLRRPRQGNRGYISSSSDDSPELPRSTSIKTPKENTETVLSTMAATVEPMGDTETVAMKQVIEDVTVTEPTSRNGDDSNSDNQAAEISMSEEINREETTGGTVTDNSISRNLSEENTSGNDALQEDAIPVTVAEEPDRVDMGTCALANGNGVTEEPIREEIIAEEPNAEAVTSLEEPLQDGLTEEQIIEQLAREDPSRNYLAAKHETSQNLAAEDQEFIDTNNGRRSRNSYRNMIEEMGYSSEDNLSDEWKDEDFTEETDFENNSASPEFTEETEINQAVITETEDDLLRRVEEQVLSEMPKRDTKAARPTGTRKKSGLGGKTVVKPYLETNLDNPVLYCLEKVCEAKSSSSRPSDEPDMEASESSPFNFNIEKKSQVSNSTEVTPYSAEEPIKEQTLEHITKETEEKIEPIESKEQQTVEHSTEEEEEKMLELSELKKGQTFEHIIERKEKKTEPSESEEEESLENIIQKPEEIKTTPSEPIGEHAVDLLTEESQEMKTEPLETEEEETLRHKVEGAEGLKTEPLESKEEQTVAYITEGAEEITTDESKSEAQTDEELSAASQTTTSPVLSDGQIVEEILKAAYQKRSGSRKRPSQKPPPPPRTASLLPSNAEPQLQNMEFPKALSLIWDHTSPPVSSESSSSSLESEALASIEGVIIREKPNNDIPHVEGMKRVSDVHEELEMIEIPRVPTPSPRDSSSQSHNLSTPSADTHQSLTSPPSALEQSTILGDLQDMHSVNLPETSGEYVQEPPSYALGASSSLKFEELFVLADKAESSDDQHKSSDEDCKLLSSRQHMPKESQPSFLEHTSENLQRSPQSNHLHVMPSSAAVDEQAGSGTLGRQFSPSQSLDSDSFLTRHLVTASPILSKSPGFDLSDLERNEIPDIPPPPPRAPPASSPMSTVTRSSQISRDSPTQSTAVPLAQMLFDFEQIDIPGVPPPPPRQSPPPPLVQGIASTPPETSLQVIPEESIIHSDTCSPAASESFIYSPDDSNSDSSEICDSDGIIAPKSEEVPVQIPIALPLQECLKSPEKIIEKLERLEIPEIPPPPPIILPSTNENQSSPLHLSGPSSLIEDDFLTELKETPINKPESRSPSISSEPSHCYSVETPSLRSLKELEDMEIPEVPPPLPRQPPPAATGSTQTIISKTLETQTNKISDEALDIFPSNQQACQKEAPDSLEEQTSAVPRQFQESFDAPRLRQKDSRTYPNSSSVISRILSQQLMEKLENIEIPEVPPPPPLQPPPRSYSSEAANSVSPFQYYTPRTSVDYTAPSCDESDKKLESGMELSETSLSSEELESPTASLNLEDSLLKTDKCCLTLHNQITSPQVASVSPPQLLETLEKMDIPEIPPPPPRQPPPLPRSLPPQHSLSFPRSFILSNTESSLPFAEEFASRNAPVSSLIGTQEESSPSTPETFTTQASEFSSTREFETSAAETSSKSNIFLPSSSTSLKPLQVSLEQQDEYSSTESTSVTLTQLPECADETFMESSHFLSSNVSFQKASLAYLARVIENSQAELSPEVEDLPQAPVQNLLSPYVTGLEKNFSPSEEETSSSSSSSEEESSSSEEEASSSSSSEHEHLSTSENEGSSVLTPEVSSVPEIKISLAPSPTHDEQREISIIPGEVAPLPDDVVLSSMSEKEVISSVPEMVSFVPEKVVFVSVPERVIVSSSSQDEVSPSSEEEICFAKKYISSLPESKAPSLPQKILPSHGVSSLATDHLSILPQADSLSQGDKAISKSEQEPLPISEHQASSISAPGVPRVPEISISSAPSPTPVEQQEISFMSDKEAPPENLMTFSAAETMISSVTEDIFIPVPEKDVVSSLEDEVVVCPVLHEIISSKPERDDLSSVPEMISAGQEEADLSSVPEMVSSETEKDGSVFDMVSSEPEKDDSVLGVISSEPEKDDLSYVSEMVHLEPKKDDLSSVSQMIPSKPEEGDLSSVSENVVISIVQETKSISSVPDKVTVPEKKKKNSLLETVVASSVKEMVCSAPDTMIVSSMSGKKTISPVPEKERVSSEPEKLVYHMPEKIVGSSVLQEELVSSVSEKVLISSLNEKMVVSSVKQEEEVSSVPEKVLVSSVLQKMVVLPEKEEVSPEPKKNISSGPEEDAISYLPPEVSSSPEEQLAPILGQALPLPDEISASALQNVSCVPEITISFAADMEVPYASESEEAVFSAPDKVPSLVEEEVSSASETSSGSGSETEQVVLLTTRQKSTLMKDDGAYQIDSSPALISLLPRKSSFPDCGNDDLSTDDVTKEIIPEEFIYVTRTCDMSASVSEDPLVVTQEKITSSALYQHSQSKTSSTENECSTSTQQQMVLLAVEEPKEAQDGSSIQAAVSLSPASSSATLTKHSSKQAKCRPERSSTEAHRSFSPPKITLGTVKELSVATVACSTEPTVACSTEPLKSSVQTFSPETPIKSSTQTAQMKISSTPIQKETHLVQAPASLLTELSSLQASSQSPRSPTQHSLAQPSFFTTPLMPAPFNDLHRTVPQNISLTTFPVLHSDEAKDTALEQHEFASRDEAEIQKKDRMENIGKEKRNRGISQSSEETEDEYFTPPSDSPPRSPIQLRHQASFADYSLLGSQWSPLQKDGDKTFEFFTWGEELKLIVDSPQNQRDEGRDARASQASPDAGKRQPQPDLSELPSAKRRRLSCEDIEDNLMNVLTVRSRSPSRPRLSRLTNAIEEALTAEDPETSYEIQITVSVLKPSQSTSPEPRVRISTQMRGDSPAPPSQRPSCPPPSPPAKSVRPKERKKEKDTTVSSSTASPLSDCGQSLSKKESRGGKLKDRKSRKKREHLVGSETRENTVTSLEGKKGEEKEGENEAAKRAMMEYYVNNLSSDTDSDASTSSTSTSTSSSDDDGEDDGRSYQVTAPGEMGLATIEEDAEEDSGAESSGHWMFSADNTDTESVIHVPAALTPAPVEPPQRHPPEDGDSTASDETLVVEDEEDEEDVCGEGRGGRQEAGVTVSNSHARTPASTPATGGHYDSSASEDEHSSQGTERSADGSSLKAVHRRKRKPGDGRQSGGGARLPHSSMLGPAHASRIVEKHVDDVFDFESLESCESVSGGSEASSPGFPGSLSGMEEAEVVFNMSATSQPFADSSPTMASTARSKLTSGVAVGVPQDSEGGFTFSKSDEGHGTLSLIPTACVAPVGVGEEENEGNLSNVTSSTATDLVFSSSNNDGSQPAEGLSGPQSIDMFGLPVKWTPGHDPSQVSAGISIITHIEARKENSTIQMRSVCDKQTFNTKETELITSFNSLVGHHSDIHSSGDTNQPPPPEGVETRVTDATQEVGSSVCATQQQEVVSVSAFIAGENSSEARHRHTPHSPALNYHFSLASLPQQSESEALLLPLLGVSDQDGSKKTMRDARRPFTFRGDTATTAAVGGFTCGEETSAAPDSKVADYSREVDYVSSGLRPQPTRSVTCGVDFPSVDSDTDTDNTDGDYDEEDHFAAELSLRISNVPASTATKVKSFRSSDILNLIGLEGGGAGPSGAGGASGDVSPLASQTGSSPEVPDSLKSSEGRSATRSVETLSEDSGLGDRDVRLTPSSPLASISEAAPRADPVPPVQVSVTSRPRRQDIRQARIARARSCGDLRGYTDSDSEEEGSAMYGWLPHPTTQPLMEGVNGVLYNNRTHPRPYKSTHTNHLQQQQHDECRAARQPRHPHPLSGSEGSDEEYRSRFTNHRVVLSGHSKPRRHRSFHEPSRQNPVGWAGKGSLAAAPGAPRHGRRRPQPISVDLAEQFLCQEGLKSPQRKQTVEDPYGAAGEGRGEEWKMQHQPSLPGTGGVACQAARSTPANQHPPGEVSTSGGSMGSAGSGSVLCPPASSLTPELTVRRALPAAQAAPPPLAAPSRPAPAPPSNRPPGPAPLHQYSFTPAQLPNECQSVHTGRSSCSPTHDSSNNTDSELRSTSDLNEQCLSGKTGGSPAAPDGVTCEMEGGPVRVHTKTYGSHGEVEVYLARADSGCRPPNTSPVLTPRGGGEHRIGSRGVTFSPSVKEINWRESYYEAEPEGGEVAGSGVRKVLVVTSESPTPQRVDLTPSPPPPAPVPTRSDSLSINNSPEIIPPTPADSATNMNTTNGRVTEGLAGSSSDAEMSGDKSPKVQTPLWQRFRLPKISSPKSPRPKIPPKPQSLSSRSSDTESSKMSSPGVESSSSTPSSPDTKAKKAPTSPRFFSWGSKREKNVRVPPPRPVVSPPPPPAQVNAGQRGEMSGDQGGVKGEPDPAAAVSPAVLPREDRVAAVENNSDAVKKTRQRASPPACEERVTQSPARFAATEGPCFIYSDGLSHESCRSPVTSATSAEDSSDAAPHSTPRSALSKPPLPPHLQRPSQQVFHKARLLSARRQYFSQERQVSAPERSSPPKEVPSPPVPKPREALQERIAASRYNSAFDASTDLKERFERFSASARAERERLARSTPDLSVIEASVRRQGPRIDLWKQCEQEQQQAESHPASPASASDGDAARPDLAHRGASSSHQKARAAIHERYKNRAQRIHARARTQSSGVLETDLDTGASREVLTLRETNLDDLYRDLQHLLESIPPVGAAQAQSDKTRAKSLLDLEATAAMEAQLAAPARPPDTRAKSMEFLLDDGNKASIQPPENELMKGSERQLSEAELRVRRSLQRLDVPEWMKNAPPPQQGFLLRRRDYGSSSAQAGGWSAYSSKTASMTSLGSSRAVTPNTPTKVVIPTRVATRGVGGIGGITSPASNCSISPSPSDRSGSLFQYPISRWSTSRLNSGTTTPTGSVTSSRTTTTYTRQPYLGWRSQTSLASLGGSQSSLTSTGSYLTAADRLALGITSYSQRFVKTTSNTQDKENSSSEANAAAPKPESAEHNDTGSTNGSVKLQVPADVADVHSSIKEVTSAIVHYCNESTPSPRASPRGSPRPDGRAPSPRRLVWVESSFVGSRPITSPETPTSSTHAITPTSQLNGHDLPESGEVTSRPPQPPGEYLLAW